MTAIIFRSLNDQKRPGTIGPIPVTHAAEGPEIKTFLDDVDCGRLSNYRVCGDYLAMDDAFPHHYNQSALMGDEGAQAGQASLYAEASAEFALPLARLAAAYESDRSRQQDLLQEIHVSLWRSLSTFSGQCSIRTWVYRVAHNTAATHVRQQIRSRQADMISLDDLDELRQETNYERHVDDTKLLEYLNELLLRLDAIDRNVLLLYLEGLTAAEISEVVGISTSNIAQKLHRVRTYFRRHIENGGDNEWPG